MPLTGQSLIGSSGSVFGVLVGACFSFGEDRYSKMIAMGLMLAWLVPQFMYLQLSFMLGGIAYAGHIGGAIGGIIAMHMGYAPTRKPSGCPPSDK
jgi:membrane associated rhomboid family serine protease